ncbi:MAG: hypothetical protein ABMB14_23225 [Myxococcota bacterium]
MPLTDPELDLLREMLEDDPTSDVYLQVGEELVRRSLWGEATAVLSGGIARPGAPIPRRASELLARASLEAGRYGVTLTAIASLDRDPRRNPEVARLEILALERSGRLEEAKSRASAFLAHDPKDVVVASVLERLDAPPPKRGRRAADPFFTVERAERYVDLGRTDRAVRAYRRILLANRGDPAIELRMRQLMSAPADVEDDLSSELTDPGLVPEGPDPSATPPGPLEMPSPRRTPVPTSRTVGPDGLVGFLEDGPTDTPAPSRSWTPPPSVHPDEESTEQMDVLAALRRYAAGQDDDDDEQTNVDLELLTEIERKRRAR